MQHSWLKSIIVATFIASFAIKAQASTLTIKITDEQQQPIADAVVELVASTPVTPQQTTLGSIAQQDLTFVPFVSAIVAGSYIEFPNRDKTRHHVYSFSDAKSFEIQLYANKPEAPILFDKAGIVTIGCNIHDYMQAYVYIGASPLLSVSNSQGEVSFANLPNDKYQLKLWHPWQKNSHDSVSITVTRDSTIALTMAVLPKQKPTAPKRGFGH